MTVKPTAAAVAASALCSSRMITEYDLSMRVRRSLCRGHDEGYPAGCDLVIEHNRFEGAFASQGKTVKLFGVDGVIVRGNTYVGGGASTSAAERTCECCRNPAKIAQLCVNVSIE
eukprot:COSAG05_NODE_1082_length_5937_cov_2.133265_3_plen_115_part_00